ncbi:MAG TPA: hypothetical protein VGM80_01465 [Gaiellaceae bacterium]
MDVGGAEILRQRLAEQENWRQAHAVRMGRQPSFDPDGHALESFQAGFRKYAAERRVEVRAGQREIVTVRTVKRLLDGVWQQDVVVEPSGE